MTIFLKVTFLIWPLSISVPNALTVHFPMYHILQPHDRYSSIVLLNCIVFFIDQLRKEMTLYAIIKET